MAASAASRMALAPPAASGVGAGRWTVKVRWPSRRWLARGAMRVFGFKDLAEVVQVHAQLGCGQPFARADDGAAGGQGFAQALGEQLGRTHAPACARVGAGLIGFVFVGQAVEHGGAVQRGGRGHGRQGQGRLAGRAAGRCGGGQAEVIAGRARGLVWQRGAACGKQGGGQGKNPGPGWREGA